MSNKRRNFLKTTAKVGTGVALTGVAFSACSSGKKEQKEVVQGKSKKQEVLYQPSKYWDAYYKVAH